MKVWILTYYKEPDYPFRGGVVIHGIYDSFHKAEAQKESLLKKMRGYAKNFVIERKEVQ